MLLRLGQTIPIALQMANGATTVFVRASLYDATGTQLSGSPVSVPHKAGGFYATNAVTMPNSSIVYVQYIVYTDASFTTLLTTQARVLDTFVLDTNVAAIRADLERTGGMLDILPTLSEINASTVLAKQQAVANLVLSVSNTEFLSGEINNMVTAIQAKTDQLTFTGANVNANSQVVSDKTAYSLTSGERSAIAVAVEQAIMNDTDGQAVLNAIVGAIGNSNIDQIALIAAIRADLERTGGKLDTRATQTSVNAIPTTPLLAADARLNNLDAAVSTRLPTANYTAPPSLTSIIDQVERVGGMLSQRPTLAQIENSTILANQTDFIMLASSLLAARTEFAQAIAGLGVPLQAANYQAPDNSQIAEAVMNATVESGVTVRKSMALTNAAMGGLTTGAGSGVETFKSLDGTKDRIVSTVDVNGNRSSVVLDLT